MTEKRNKCAGFEKTVKYMDFMSPSDVPIPCQLPKRTLTEACQCSLYKYFDRSLSMFFVQIFWTSSSPINKCKSQTRVPLEPIMNISPPRKHRATPQRTAHLRSNTAGRNSQWVVLKIHKDGRRWWKHPSEDTKHMRASKIGRDICKQKAARLIRTGKINSTCLRRKSYSNAQV